LISQDAKMLIDSTHLSDAAFKAVCSVHETYFLSEDAKWRDLLVLPLTGLGLPMEILCDESRKIDLSQMKHKIKQLSLYDGIQVDDSRPVIEFVSSTFARLTTLSLWEVSDLNMEHISALSCLTQLNLFNCLSLETKLSKKAAAAFLRMPLSVLRWTQTGAHREAGHSLLELPAHCRGSLSYTCAFSDEHFLPC